MEPKKENRILIAVIKFLSFGYIVFAIVNFIFLFLQLLKKFEGINVFSVPILFVCAVIFLVIFGPVYLLFYVSLDKAEKAKNLQAIIYLLVGIAISTMLSLYK